MNRYGFPTQEEYYDLERKTVQRLNAWTVLSRNEFCEARLHVNQLKGKLEKREHQNNCIDFTFPFDTRLENKGKWQRVKLHAEIRFASGRLESDIFTVEIFGEKGSKDEHNVIRRIHFDVAIPYVEKNKVEHPVYHVQFAGKSRDSMSDELKEQKQFSFPRIPYRPLSIALFVDMAIRELGTVDLKAMIKNGNWRSVVRKSEDLMLAPFFSNLKDRRERDPNFIFSDLYYEPGDQTD